MAGDAREAGVAVARARLDVILRSVARTKNVP